MSSIKNLEPKTLWNYFHEITQIPHPSKKEEKLIVYMREFGQKNNLETIVDKAGNVILRKPATKGMEYRKGVILQAHLDMVPQKNSDKIHDFENDPIEPIIVDDWVTANGTTLGSDNGIGVAAAMAILTSQDIPHGPLEALFTVDEETGMTGVFALEPGLLKGKILLNLDSEDEGELCVGCAGGIDVNVRKKYILEDSPDNMVAYRIMIKGLKGGHSGVDINLGRANSIKIMFRFLMQAESDFGIRISEVAGGDLRNAIPRESYSIVLVQGDKAARFRSFIEHYQEMYCAEFSDTDPDISFSGVEVPLPRKVLKVGDQYKLIRAVYVCPNGVQRMSRAMDGLVETSNNLAIVRCIDGKFEAHNLTRSSVDTAKIAVAWKIAACFHLVDAEVELMGGYPGWKPNMNSEILKIMSTIHKDMFGKEPDVKAIHAGLECGIIAGTYPDMDMISFGPTIKWPHSPDERVSIPSVGKFFDYLCEILKQIPVES